MSFSLDINAMMTFANSIFSGLSPIVVIVGGISLGIGLVGMVLAYIKNAIRL